jgi:signal recognition particle subunit SRP72
MEDSDREKLELIYKNLKEAIESDASHQDIEKLVEKIHENSKKDDNNELKKDKDYKFLYVYALHRLGRQSEARSNFDNLGLDQNDYYTGLLYAQILYKLDEKEKSSEIYERILESGDNKLNQDLNEILTNILASYSQTDSEYKVADVDQKVKGEITSDYVFNSAILHASIDGQEKIAAKKLKESYDIAKSSGEADSNKFPVMSSFIASKLISKASNSKDYDWGSLKVDESDAKSFKNIDNEVAYLNNIACIKMHLGLKEANISLSNKISKALKSGDINQHQKETFFFNLLNLSLKNNKVSDVKKLINEVGQLSTKFGDDFTKRLQIAKLLLENKHSEALEIIGSPNTVFEALCKAQIQISSGKFKEAIRDLISHCDHYNVSNSRLLSFLLKATIDNKLNEEKHQIIELAIKSALSLPKDVLIMIGHILIEDQNFLKALEVFEAVKDDTDDLSVKAGYLSALAEKDVKSASQYLKTLNFTLPDLETEEDFHELLEEPLSNKPSTKKRIKKEGDKIEETAKGGKIFIPKAKANTKIKYPKNFDPANPGALPDPERWIPKWQRSKGKKKLKMRGPQGDVRNIGVVNKKDKSTANIEASTGFGGKKKK